MHAPPPDRPAATSAERIDAPMAPIDDAQIRKLRDKMLRFASLQLRDEHLAEDAVQEAMAAALAGASQHTGAASWSTWVFAILKNKIVDIIRHRSQSINVSSLSTDELSMDERFDALFEANQHWSEPTRPVSWGNPEQALRNQQFMVVLEACLRHLPDNTARVFMMREMLELDTQEVCAELSITVNHCNVILHRARNGLRACLEKHWFQAGVQPC